MPQISGKPISGQNLALPASSVRPAAEPTLETAVQSPAETRPETQPENHSPSIGPSSPTAQTHLSLGLDDPKPAAPDRDPQDNRFPDRGRSIQIPLLHLDAQGGQGVNPLPAGGLHLQNTAEGQGLVLEHPPQRAGQIFASMDAPSQMVATLFDHLSARYPKLEKAVLYRLAVATTYVAVDVPLMVAAHEMGHGAKLQEFCSDCEPDVVMTHWMSGFTRYNTGDKAFSESEELRVAVAGMNQATYQGEELQRRMHTEGADLKDAIGYLVNITNSVNYQIKDWVQHNPPGFDDAATYHALMAARDKGWNQENLSLLALGANLANADFWASLIGSARYIATGEQVRMPEVQVGDNHLSLPHFAVLHTYEGPQVDVSLFAHRETPATLELKYSQILTPDNGPALGFETRLHNLDIPGTQHQLSLSPRLGFSTHNQSLGFKAGTGLEYRPGNNPYLAVTAGVDYRHNYLPDAYLPGLDGIQVDSGVKLSF